MLPQRPHALQHLPDAASSRTLARLSGLEGLARATTVTVLPLAAADALGSTERVSYAYTRGYGNFRPLTLEIARRLVDRGVLDETEDVFCLTRTEMEAAVHGDHSTDTRALVQARRAEMQRLAGAAMPEVIFGDEFEPAPPAVPGQRLSGVPSARGISHGLARIVRGIEEAERVVDGDVLVIPYSDIGWTPLLSRAGGIVAEAGGLLSHSSIVAREVGIPCVVSVSGAMGIPDGALVRVDGFTGEVQWELPAAAT